MALTPEQQLSEDKAQAVRFGVTEPTVSAIALETPPEKVNPPVPKVSTNDGSRTAGLIDSVASNTQSFIQAQSEEAAKAKELAGLLGEQTFDGASQREQLGKEYGLPDNLSRLTDIQTQLAKANTASDITKSRIAGAAGQTMAQGQREITQEDRENAIRTAGLAAEAAVLQGSVQTASTLINQAMSDYYNDRQLQNANMIQQLNYFSGIADKQTAQLLQKEQRKYEEDQAQIVRAQSAVDSAVSSGYATPEDMKQITALSGDPEAQGAYARSVVAQGAIQERMLSNMAQRASIASSATARRKTLIDLGIMGDPTAIAELGFDPRAEIQAAADAEAAQAGAEQQIAYDKEVERLDDVMDDITEIIGNDSGLKNSSGQFRNATMAGLTPFVGETLNQKSGGISGAASARQQKDDWLAQVSTILTEEGFEALIDINDRVRLTPITEMEVNLAFKSASDLQNAARYKGSIEEGNRRLVGFAMSEDKVREAFADMYIATQKAQEEIKGIQEYGYEGYVRLLELQQESQ